MTRREWQPKPGEAEQGHLPRRKLLHTAAVGMLALTGMRVAGRVRADDGYNITPDTLQAATDDYALEATDPLAASLNAPRRVASVAANIAPDGASGANITYVEGKTANWFIEEQRNARDAIIGGLVVGDHNAVAAGFAMIAWGATRQAADGSFAGTWDAFHSTAFFVEATAHALLCTLGSPYAARYAAEVARYTPMLARAAGWMTMPEVWEPGVRANTPYTHRRYIVAGALGLTMCLTGDDAPRARMAESLMDGLALQRADGNNPEKDGTDSSYHMVGLCYAERWAAYLAADPLAPDVRAMIDRGLAWASGRILPDGTVDITDNTRTAGQETTRDMTTKTVAYTQVVRGFLYWGLKTDTAEWVELGQRVATQRGYLAPPPVTAAIRRRYVGEQA